MTTTSPILIVSDKLKELIEVETANLGFEGVPPDVFFSYEPSTGGYDQVSIGDIISRFKEYPVMKASRKPREESYVQKVKIICSRPGTEARESVEAMLAIEEKIENLIANDPNIGLTEFPSLRLNIVDAPVNTIQDEALRGWRCTCTLHVSVNVRLR